MLRAIQYCSPNGYRRHTRTRHRKSRLRLHPLGSCYRRIPSRQRTRASLARSPAGMGGICRRTRMRGHRSRYPSAHGGTPSLGQLLSLPRTLSSTIQLLMQRTQHTYEPTSANLPGTASLRVILRKRILERTCERASQGLNRQDRTPLSDRRLHAQGSRIRPARPRRAHTTSRLALRRLRSTAKRESRGLRQ